jgi:hypothetical protein
LSSYLDGELSFSVVPHRILAQQILSELGPLLVNIFHDRKLEKNIPEKLSN